MPGLLGFQGFLLEAGSAGFAYMDVGKGREQERKLRLQASEALIQIVPVCVPSDCR